MNMLFTTVDLKRHRIKTFDNTSHVGVKPRFPFGTNPPMSVFGRENEMKVRGNVTRGHTERSRAFAVSPRCRLFSFTRGFTSGYSLVAALPLCLIAILRSVRKGRQVMHQHRPFIVHCPLVRSRQVCGLEPSSRRSIVIAPGDGQTSAQRLQPTHSASITRG